MIDLVKRMFQRLFGTGKEPTHDIPPTVSLGTCGNYCISLASQPERLIETRAQLARYGIEVEHFPGIPSAEAEKRITRKDGVPEGAHGAMQAFINLFKHIVASHPPAQGSDRPYVAVFEDDILPLDNFGGIAAHLARVPGDWDFISLGGNFHQTQPEILNDSVTRLTCAFNLHAQLIRVDFLPGLIERLERREYEVDVMTATMQEQRLGNWYGFTSDFVWQHARNAFFCISLWEHQLGLFHFAKANGVVDRFLIKNLLRRP